MTGLLASVATPAEAEIARDGGADILDFKDPARGALGAWDTDDLRRACHRAGTWRHRPLLSATIGDLPMDPKGLAEAARRTAEAGVDFVKIGVFPSDRTLACLAALAGAAADGHRLVAVLLADRAPDLALVEPLARAGFAGVMLDTADKAAGGLRRHLGLAALDAFVARGRRAGLLTGLAGSLTLADVPLLAPLGPDYLGFRGALCAGQARTAAVVPAAVIGLRRALDAAIPAARRAGPTARVPDRSPAPPDRRTPPASP